MTDLLFEAAEQGDIELIRVLLNDGTPADLRDDSGATALFYATMAEGVRLLVETGCPVDVFDIWNRTALLNALEHEDRAEVVQALVAAGANIEQRDQYGWTPLYRFCGSGEISAPMIQLLLDLGANVHTTGEYHRTPLHYASQLWNGDRMGRLAPAIRILVQAGIPVDVRDDYGLTPLHLAVGDEGMDLDAVEALLDLGADVNGTDNDGRTPLMINILEGHNTHLSVPLLLRRGSDLYLKDKNGKTAWDYCVERIELWNTIRFQRNRMPVVAQHEELFRGVHRHLNETLGALDEALKKQRS